FSYPRSTKPPKYLARFLGPFVPGQRLDDRFHESDCSHTIRVAARPVKPERGTPVVDHQGDAFERQRVVPGVEIAGVIDEAASDAGLAGLAHADEIGGEAPARGLESRDDVAPEVGRRGIAVQEDDRITAPRLAGAHPGIEDRDVAIGHDAAFPSNSRAPSIP